MGASDWIAAVAAIISIGSAYAAWQQAASAKTSAGAADTQAKSAQRSAEIAEAAQKFERLEELQRARQILNEVRSSAGGAFREAAGIAKERLAQALSERALKAAHELHYMPIATAPSISDRASKLHELVTRFGKMLAATDYRIWSKEELRQPLVMLNLEIDQTVDELEASTDDEVARIWAE